MAAEDSQVGTRLLCLADPRDATKFTEMKAVDVVAVHGLDAAGSGSWTTQDGTLWLRDLLPSDIPCARVLAFLYDAEALFSRFPADIESVARSLLSALAMSRGNVPSMRPLVLVGHGLGGFIIEAVVNYAISHETFPDIKGCLKKVIFLSTPQRSSPEIPWKTLLVNSAKDSLYELHSSTIVDIDLLRCIERNAQSFQKVRAEFRKHAISLKLKILTCYEDVLTPPQQFCTVTEFCATLALKAEKVHRMNGCNHLSTARFENRDDDNYKAVISAIKRAMKVPTTAPGPTVPDKPEQSRASSDNNVALVNSSANVSASVTSPAELPQVPEVLVQNTSINRGDISQRPEAAVHHPRSLSTSIVGTTSSTQMSSSIVTHVDKPPQRPSLPSSLSIQAPTRHLSLSGIGHHDAIAQPNSIPDILKPRPNSLHTHTAPQVQTHPESASRQLSTSTVTTEAGSEKPGSSQKFIPYRPFATEASVASTSGQGSIRGNAQTYKPFRPLSMQIPLQQDQTQHIHGPQPIKAPSTLPMREPPSVPRSTFPRPASGASLPSIPALGRNADNRPPLDRGLTSQALQGITYTGPGTSRDISSSTLPLPIPRSIQPANPPAQAPMRELPTAFGPSGTELATSQLPGSLQTQRPTSLRSSGVPFNPVPPAPTTSRNLPSQPTSGAPVVNIAVSASSAARGINEPSPTPTTSSGPIIPPKQMPYRGPPIQPAAAPPRGPPSNSQPPMPRSLGINRPPDPTTTRGFPVPSSTTQPPQPSPKQGQGPPMQSSISGPPGAQPPSRPRPPPPGPTPIWRGPPGPAPNFGPRGVAPLQSQAPRPEPSRPPLTKPALPRPMPARAPVPAPSATRGLQTGPKPPPKPPGILNKLFGSSTPPSAGPTRGPPPAGPGPAPAPAGRGIPKPAPSGGKYTPHPGPMGPQQPQPKAPFPPQTRSTGPAYHPSPHANDAGKDMGWKHTGEGLRGFHQPHISTGSQGGHQTNRGLNSLYFSDQPIPPPQLPILQTQPQAEGLPGYLQSQTQTQTQAQVQGPVQPVPGDQKPEEKESSSSGSTIKIAAGVAVGAAIGGLATGAVISALQEESEGESEEHKEAKGTQEPVQSDPESPSPVSGSVTREDIPGDVPPSNQGGCGGGGDIDPEDPNQRGGVAEIEAEMGSTSGDNSISTPGSTSDSEDEGSDEDEGGYSDGYDDDADGSDYEHDEDDDDSHDSNYDDAQLDHYNSDEDEGYDEYDSTDHGDDDGQDEFEYENGVEPTYQEGNQHEDHYQDEDTDEDEHYTYEEEDDQGDEGYPDYQYQGEYENNEPGDGDDGEEEGQTYESGDEYQEGEYSNYEHQGQYDHEEGDEDGDDDDEDDDDEDDEDEDDEDEDDEDEDDEDEDDEDEDDEDEDDESENEQQTGDHEGESAYQETEYVGHEYDYIENDDDDDEDEYQGEYEGDYQTDHQQYEPEYQAEYQAPGVEYEPEPDYQQYEPEYQVEYQPEYQEQYQTHYEPEYQAAYEPEYQVEYQQEYQPEYEPEYEEQTDYGGYGGYEGGGYDYDDGYY